MTTPPLRWYRNRVRLSHRINYRAMIGWAAVIAVGAFVWLWAVPRLFSWLVLAR